MSLWQQYTAVQFAPDHLLSELGFSIVFELVQFIALALLWRKVIAPRLTARIHKQIDAEHGIEHEEAR
jgi:hypothetical protein